MVADPGAVEENIGRVLDSWQELRYMKPDMRDVSIGMTGTLYRTVDSEKRKFCAIKYTSLYAINIMLAAISFGLETHPMDGFDEGCIKKELGIPQDNIIPKLVAVGWLRPRISLLPRAFRRNLDEFISFNAC